MIDALYLLLAALFLFGFGYFLTSDCHSPLKCAVGATVFAATACLFLYLVPTSSYTMYPRIFRILLIFYSFAAGTALGRFNTMIDLRARIYSTISVVCYGVVVSTH